jgi:hypothetical protein
LKPKLAAVLLFTLVCQLLNQLNSLKPEVSAEHGSPLRFWPARQSRA